MECFNLQALGSSESSSSESESDNEKILIDEQNLSCDGSGLVDDESVQDEAALLNKKKEELIEQYKNGLKQIAFENFDEAESILDSLLSNDLLNNIQTYEDRNEDEKDLIKLKYAILKNLSSINGEKCHNYSKALDYLIQAAKIDATDSCLWFDMGDSALKLNKYLIAKHAFEESLRLNSNFWPCVDKLIVLLYSLGNYSLCLKYLFDALTMDKFYINGLILLKKYADIQELDYRHDIDIFLNLNYISCGLCIDSYLSQLSDVYYQDLIERVDEIKLNYRQQLFRLRQSDNESNNRNVSIKISNKINTLEGMGNLLIKLNENSEMRFDLPVKLVVEEEKNFPTQDIEPAEETKINDLKETGQSSNNRGLKRKGKPDNAEESWWKRRSLRKGIDKNDQAITVILDILRKFFPMSYLGNELDECTPTKKLNSAMDSLKVNFESIRECESTIVKSMIDSLSAPEETSLFEMVKLYLQLMAINYDKLWYGSMCDVFVTLFNVLNRQYDLMDAISQESDEREFVGLCSIVLVRLEIEFSRYKDLKIKFKKDDEQTLDPNDNRTFERLNKQMLKSIFRLHELEFVLEKYLNNNNLKMPITSVSCLDQHIRSLLPRIWCLLLYSSFNFADEQLCAEYFVSKLNEFFDTNDRTNANETGTNQGNVIKIANSNVFQSISRDALKEFLKMNKRNKIMELNDLIERMFIESRFQDIIDNLEEFADTHKLPLGDEKFRPTIYLQLLSSYLNLTPKPSVEKFAYFLSKFMRQTIKYLNDEVNNLVKLSQQIDNKSQPSNAAGSSSATTLLTSDSNDESTCKKYEQTIKSLNIVSEFVNQLVDLTKMALNMSEKYEGTMNDEDRELNRKELVWLMYQLIAIYFDNNQDLALKLDLKQKPLTTFVIIFELMCDNELSERTEYLSLVHEYLARNGFCGSNEGQYLLWCVGQLTAFKSQCSQCNQKDGRSATLPPTESSDETNSQTGTETEESRRNKTVSQPASNSCICHECDELLEQCFYCLFGFKKKSAAARYLKTHSVIKLPYNLENSIRMYDYFKPARLPEYDDQTKSSISSEFYEFLFELLKLASNESENFQIHIEHLKENFFQALETENFNQYDQLIDSLACHSSKEEAKFRDIYYLIADYNLKLEKNFEKQKMFVHNYYTKDLTINRTRFDSWAALALYFREDVLSDYLEKVLNIRTNDELRSFLKMVFLCINLFRKAIEFIRPGDYTLLFEYGSFLYQLSSFCSRQIKLSKLVPSYFENESIDETLKTKQHEFLKLALDAYQKAQSAMTSSTVKTAPSTEDTSSSSGDKDRTKSSAANEYEENGEEWLNHYMFGKIKEKLNYGIMDCLEHYIIAYEYLEKNISVFLKRINYKSKSCLNLECNEVVYRIYALSLKRLPTLNEDDLQSLLSFLEGFIEFKFVTIHDDFLLNETTAFLESEVFSKSVQLNQMPNKDLIKRCVCICVTGLNQILKRFSQHYRSLYRLAHFYMKFLDFKNYKISRHLLLSIPNWSSFAYMPCQGLFHERNKTNFFNGIWRISSNTKEEQQDFERAGSFSNHLFKSVILLIETLDHLHDYPNLIELSKSFYQKLDPEKKYLKDDLQREYIANVSLLKSYDSLEVVSGEKFKKSLNDLNDFINYQNDLIPILLDSFEAQKLASKYQESISANLNNLLLKLYIQFHPEVIEQNIRVSMEDITKFCLLVERKDKANKVKPKAPKGSLNIPAQNQPGTSSQINQSLTQ